MTDSSKPSSLVTFLLDRTGSMQSCRDATIEGFNGYLASLQAEQDAEILFSLIQFDHHAGHTQLEKVCVTVPVAEVRPLTRETFVPRGGTPLIEAAYCTIKAVEAVVAIRTDKPRVVVCIQTDGQENQSGPGYSWEELKALVAAKREEGWEVNFLGAGIDAYEQGTRMGVSAANTMSYNSADAGTVREAFVASARNTADYASLRASSTAYSVSDRVAAGDRYMHGVDVSHLPNAMPGTKAVVGPKQGYVTGAQIAPAIDVLNAAVKALASQTPPMFTLSDGKRHPAMTGFSIEDVSPNKPGPLDLLSE